MTKKGLYGLGEEPLAGERLLFGSEFTVVLFTLLKFNRDDQLVSHVIHP